MSWFEPAGEGHALRMAWLDGDVWSEPSTIAEGDSFFVNWADYPKVLPLADGRLAAHYPWMNGTGTYSYDVVMRFSDDGGATWGPRVRPHTDGTPTEHGFVSMVPAGDAVRAVWLDGRKGAGLEHGHDDHGPGADMTLRTAVVHADGRLEDEREIDGRVCECCGTSAAVTADGFIVSYRDRSEEEVRDFHLARYGTDGWSETYPLHQDGWQIAGCPVNGAALAASGNRVVATWYTAPADSPQVLVASSSDGGVTFGAPLRVDEGSAIGRVAVAMLDADRAVVAWVEQDGEGAAIRMCVIGEEGASDPVTVAATSASRASGFPQVVNDGERLVFAWTEPGEPAAVHVATMPLP